MTMHRLMTVGRRGLVGLWVVLLAGAIVLAAWSRLAPALGHELFIVRGGSMEPAIPIGSLIVAQPTAAERISVGDIVTVVADNGVLVTHRVIRAADSGSGVQLELKGDANASPDPYLVSATAVSGVVRLYLPLLGYLTAMFMTPAGILSVGGALLAMLLLIMVLEDSASNRTGAARPGMPPSDLRDRGVAS